MQGNNREAERHRIENEIIDMIDSRRQVKDPQPITIHLRVPIMELIAYRAAESRQAIQIPGINS